MIELIVILSLPIFPAIIMLLLMQHEYRKTRVVILSSVIALGYPLFVSLYLWHHEMMRIVPFQLMVALLLVGNILLLVGAEFLDQSKRVKGLIYFYVSLLPFLTLLWLFFSQVAKS